MEDIILKQLSIYTHPDIVEARQCISKSKLKTGKERYMLLEKAKFILYTFSGDSKILMQINSINKLLS